MRVWDSWTPAERERERRSGKDSQGVIVGRSVGV